MGILDSITNPFVSKGALEKQKNIERLYNIDPKSKLIGTFQAITKKTAYDVALIVAPFASAFVKPIPIVGLVLEDSLLLRPLLGIKDMKKNFEVLRIFWDDAEKYNLKISAFGLFKRKAITIEWVFEEKKYKLENILMSNKDQWDKLNPEAYELLLSMC